MNTNASPNMITDETMQICYCAMANYMAPEVERRINEKAIERTQEMFHKYTQEISTMKKEVTDLTGKLNIEIQKNKELIHSLHNSRAEVKHLISQIEDVYKGLIASDRI